MPEPLTKEERELARGYAEGVYAHSADAQEHTAAVMILRLLDTVAALEAENARLRPLAEVGEAVEGMGVHDALAEYEAEHYPIDPPTPEAAAEFRREQEADGE
jgi:hypothetical protein